MNQTSINQNPQLKDQLLDIFLIYLESDIAGDNEDRRKKLNCFSEINAMLKQKKNRGFK